MIDFDKDKYYYDEEAVDKVVSFITKRCKHVYGDLVGLPLIPPDFWIDDIIAPAFGIKKKDGRRRFKTVYLEIGKGNAKSTMGAALGLYLLTERERGAQIYGAAGDSAQAHIIFDTAKDMVLQDEKLKRILQPYRYSIVKRNSSNFYKVISSEAKSKHGYIPTAILFDELHVQPNRELWDTLTAGQMKIDDSITFAFTTAGFDKESICYEQHEKAVKIKEGVIKDDSFLGIIYSAPKEAPIDSIKTWRMANPGLGTIIKEENLKIEYNKVKTTPSYENTFRRLHLNQWTSSEIQFVRDEDWTACEGEIPDLAGSSCYGGLDLASVRDITALTLSFPSDGRLYKKYFFWLPEDTIEDRDNKGIPYSQWVREGWMQKTPGNVTDYGYIKKTILEAMEQYDIKAIAFDRWNSSQLVQELIDDGVPLKPYGQGYASMNAPTKEFEKMVLNREIVHDGNPVMRWMMSNVMIKQDPAGNMKIDKSKSREKVDGPVSDVMSLGIWMDVENKEVKAGITIIDLDEDTDDDSGI